MRSVNASSEIWTGAGAGLLRHARLDLVQFEFQWVLPLDQFVQLQQSGLVGIQQPLALLLQQVLPPGVPFGDHRCGLRDGGPGVTDALRLPQEVGERLPDQRFDQITRSDCVWRGISGGRRLPP